MKKKGVYFGLLLMTVIFLGTLMSGCGNTKTSVTKIPKVKLNEVVRSVFYAPMYAAINLGYFNEQGLDLELSTGQGADKTMQQVLSKNADIGFCGPEQCIYVHNQNREDYPVVFAQLTQRDGSFLVSREKYTKFKWKDLKGKNIIGARPGGVPEMALEYVLKKNGLDIKKDVNIVTNIDYTATAGAFKAGTGDFVALFEPNASMLVSNNAGFITASIGAEAGPLPYTCFFCTKSYMDKNGETIQKFTNAIYKGQQWVKNNSNEKVAGCIKSFFPGTDIKLITENIKNYKKVNAYAESPIVQQQDVKKLMDIIQSYNPSLIKTRPEFNKLVNNTFAQNAEGSK